MNERAIETAVREAAEGIGFDVIDLKVAGRTLRAKIDRAEGLGAVTVEDCATTSRAIEAALRRIEYDPGTFRIVVESPGVERPLTRPRDFERFKGERVQVTLKEKRDGQRHFTGALVARSAEGDVTLRMGEGGDAGAEMTFRAPDVKGVRLAPDPAKPGKPPRA